MKKYVNPIPDGGAPLHNNRISSEFQIEIWEAMQSLLSGFDSDVEGLIVSGCEITNNAGNFDMSAGIVYLNGEFMRINAVTNLSFPRYIAPSNITYESKPFFDGVTRELIEVKMASVDASTPVSGQYLTISSLTSVDKRRYKPVLTDNTIRTKVIDIGDWDMSATATVTVAHGIDPTKIRSISALIRNDSDDAFFPLGHTQGTEGTGAWFSPPAGGGLTSLVRLTRFATGFFDSTSFNSTSYNRGWITITYTE